MLDFLKRKKQQTDSAEGLARAAQLGADAGNGLYEAVDEFLAMSFDELGRSYMNIFEVMLEKCFKEGSGDDFVREIAILAIRDFETHCDTLPQKIRENAALALSSWMPVADAIGGRELVNRTIDARTATWLVDLKDRALTYMSLRVWQLSTPEQRTALSEGGKAVERERLQAFDGPKRLS